jgi:hypothetical protein
MDPGGPSKADLRAGLSWDFQSRLRIPPIGSGKMRLMLVTPPVPLADPRLLGHPRTLLETAAEGFAEADFHRIATPTPPASGAACTPAPSMGPGYEADGLVSLEGRYGMAVQ